MRSAAPGSRPRPSEERAARRPVGGERVGLPSTPVQGQHLELPDALVQRMRAHERLELRKMAVRPRGEVGRDALGGALQAKGLDARDLGLGEGLATDVGQGRPPPQRERGRKRRGRLRRLPVRQLRPAPSQQGCEAVGVERLGIDADAVPAAAGRDGIRPDRRPQAGRGDLHGVSRVRRRCVCPERVDDRVERDDAVAVDEEQAEQPAAFRAARAPPGRRARPRAAPGCGTPRPPGEDIGA